MENVGDSVVYGDKVRVKATGDANGRMMQRESDKSATKATDDANLQSAARVRQESMEMRCK